MTAVSPDTRRVLYLGLQRRNRRIAALRIAVPVVGVLFLAIPVLQVVLSSLAPGISIEGIRLQSDTLVVEAPQFEGTLANGDVYVMVAERAESRVGDLDVVDLYELDLDLSGEAGYSASAHLTRGAWTLSTEQLYSNEDVEISDSTGARGWLAGVEVDWPGQVVTSDGPVRFEFEGGNSLVAQEMDYDMEASHWMFTRVQLEMTPAADAGEVRDIDDFIAPPAPSADAPTESEAP